MQVRRTRWNSGVKSVAVAIALALAVCGVLPALAENVVPVANAGPDQHDKALGALITLDGSVSSDVNGDPLTYRWSLSSPAGSAAVLANPTSVMPTFTVDRAGIYTAQLIVHDGTLSSAPDSVIITSVDATPTGNRVFFRGGYAALTSDRGGELFTDGHTGQNDGTSGYYVGGGMDLMLTRDLWGMTKNIALLGEIGVEFKRFNSETVANSDTTGVTGVSNAGRNKEQITMLTVDIAPKVKFMQGHQFPTLDHPGRVGFSRDQPDVKSDQLLGHRCAVRRRGGISDLERVVAGYGRAIPLGLQSNQHDKQLRHGGGLCSNRILKQGDGVGHALSLSLSRA